MGNAMTIATYQPGPSDGIDTFLKLTEQGTSILLTGYAPTGGRVLIKFDLSNIPSPSTCISAVLSFWPLSGVSGNTWTAYSILSANSGWTESGATWTTKDGSTPWAGSDGCSTSGTDYNGTSIGSITWANNNNEQTLSLDTSVVQNWFGASNTNYGIIFIPNSVGTGLSVFSSDYTDDAGKRPKLVVNYSYGTVQRRSLSSLGAGIGKRQVQP